MKIAVVGIGYVGLSNAILLAPIKDEEISYFLKHKNLNLFATTNIKSVLNKVDFIIIATPTNYDEITHSFDTSSVESVIETVIDINPEATIVIKSTIPVGYIDSIKRKYRISNIFFSPEFLREGKALYDNLYPSRIIIGEKSERAELFANMLKDSAHKDEIEILYTNSTEAEAIKLFANTYLAMRVAFFNELDTYAELKRLNSKQIIDGISLDPRIGSHYNNPSFGYGGYCLPKDTKQMLANFEGVPNTIIKAIVDANDIRKSHIANQILLKNPKIVGIYRLTMKSNSDNFRQSAIQDVTKLLEEQNIEIIIFEPSITEDTYEGYKICNDFHVFSSHADVIIANRLESELTTVINKVYTRDVFGRD